MLTSKIKDLKRKGKENVEHKQPISSNDLQRLKRSPVFNPLHPFSLLRNVWFHVVLFWCRRGREGQRNLKPSSFKFEVDEKGRRYAKMTHDELTKNHQGGLKNDFSHEKDGRLYETDTPNDGCRALQLYLSKLHPRCEAFFQLPKRDWKTDMMNEPVWYENRPLGVNTLGNMMKQISTAAGFSQIYTNHCVRATAITVWTEAGLSDRQICHISGHKNPASLRHYNSRPSNDQLRQCSDALSDAMQDQNSLQQLPKQQLPLRAMSFQRNESSSTCTQVENILGGMFNSCSVKGLNIQINVNSFPQDQKYTLKLLF